MQRLMRLVMGTIRASRQDFKSRVGMKSREQVESDMPRIAFLTSVSVAVENFDKMGGGVSGSL